MPIKFVPLNSSEIVQFQEVRESHGRSGMGSQGVASDAIFYAGMGKGSTVRDNKRGYMHLPCPVINEVIAGSKADLLGRILGLSPKVTEGLYSLDLVVDKISGALVPSNTVDSVTPYLWGADAFRYFIRKLDVQARVEEVLYNSVFKKFKPVKSVGDYHIIGDWYASDKLDEAEIQQTVIAYFTSNNTLLSYLFNLTDLNACIMDNIVVIPIGMRPSIDRRPDAITAAYFDVFNAKISLSMFQASNSVAAFKDAYKALQQAVNYLLCEQNPFKDTRRSIIDKLAGKTGHIRGRMLGKRIDYSGRSVITVDPNLSICDIKLPPSMIPKLFQHHVLSSLTNPVVKDVIGAHNRATTLAKIKEKHINEKVPVVIGRQPTLTKLSMQAYNWTESDTRSIVVNPLCVEAFNADFDGDQMYARVPNLPESVKDARELLFTTNNLFYPKNGAPKMVPRQEMIYGLYVCTRSTYTLGAPKCQATADTIFPLIESQWVKVYDTVNTSAGPKIAGYYAVECCIFQPTSFEIVEITSKTIRKYVEYLLSLPDRRTVFQVGIDKLVRLGFKVAELYPPPLMLFEECNLTKEFDDFNKTVLDDSEWYYRGYDTEDAFTMSYNDVYEDFEKKVAPKLESSMHADNGFVTLKDSGARGSNGNLKQLFGYKGRVQKPSGDVFNTVVTHSYVEGLTPLEHFITAYGSRKGLIDKSLTTADTGYASRQMWHTTQPFYITCEDCGTTEGLLITKSDIRSLLNISDENTVRSVFASIIAGRYEATTNEYITDKMAEHYSTIHETMTIRSPIKCKHPCCAHCYGRDLSTRAKVCIGEPIGVNAAPNIGALGTQLSMDSFKKGGVASKGQVISSFMKLNMYIHLQPLSHGYPAYDPVAWCSGNVIELPGRDGQKVVMIEGSKKKVTIPSAVLIKKVAVQGEGLCVERGDYDIHELLNYAGLDAAQKYLLYTLLSIYRDEEDINIKHFEVLVAAMTMHLIVATDRDDLKVGAYCDSVQLLSKSLTGTKYISVLKGIRSIPSLRPQPLSQISMEQIKSGLARSVLQGYEDPLLLPISRMLLGKSMNLNSREKRKGVI